MRALREDAGKSARSRARPPARLAGKPLTPPAEPRLPRWGGRDCTVTVGTHLSRPQTCYVVDTNMDMDSRHIDMDMAADTL